MRTKQKFISGFSTRQFLIAIIIVGIFTLGLLLRVLMTAETKVSIPIRADAKDYYLYAYNMIEYGVYSRQAPGKFKGPKPVADAHRAPGYPLFLVPFVKFPPTFKMVNSIAVTQAIISALTILAAIACFKSFLSWPWTFAAALLTAISPHLIAFNIYLLTECVFTFSLVLLTLAMVRLVQNRDRLHAIVVGLATGVSFLIRPTMLYFIVFLVPVFFIFFKKKKGAVLALFLVIGFFAVWGPWTLRNILVKPRKSTLAVQTIHKGMYPNLTYHNDPKTYGIPNHFDPTWKQLRDMRSVFQEIIRRFKKAPLRYLRWYIIGKPVVFFSWDMIVGMGDVFIYPVFTSPYHHPSGVFGLTHRLMKSLHGLLTVLALLTSLFLWFPVARKILPENSLRVARFISLLMFYFILVHIAGTPLPRYSVPLRPFVYGLAMLGIHLAVKEGPQYFQKFKPAN